MRLLLAALLAGCGSSSSQGSDALSGTWDVTETAVGGSTPTTYTITVEKGAVSVNREGTSVQVVGDGASVTWDSTLVTSTHSANGNAGELPINPIGDWIFTEAGAGNFTASLTGSSLTTTCSTRCSNRVLGSSFTGNLTGVKSAPGGGDSIWGDLAGMWQISDQGGAQFTAALIGSALQASYTSSTASSTSFTVSATLNGNLLSGSSSHPAFEFSARRR